MTGHFAVGKVFDQRTRLVDLIANGYRGEDDARLEIVLDAGTFVVHRRTENYISFTGDGDYMIIDEIVRSAVAQGEQIK